MPLMRKGQWVASKCGGGILVEVGLLFPLYLMVLFGALEGARAWFSYNLLTHAVREGTRLAAVTPSLQAEDERVLSRIEAILQAAGLQTANSSVALDSSQGHKRMVRVRAQVEFVPLVAMVWPKRTGPTIPLTAEMVTRYELGDLP